LSIIDQLSLEIRVQRGSVNLHATLQYRSFNLLGIWASDILSISVSFQLDFKLGLGWKSIMTAATL
jgi:hypothetical protein